MSVKKKQPSARATQHRLVSRLVLAMDRCALARGEAQWTNGYRAGAVGVASTEHDRLYEKERRQWAEVERRENAFRRLATRIVTEARRA